MVHDVYASCGNRNCPICPALKKEIWLLKRQNELLPVQYYHVVFTLPHELNDLCVNHPRVLYNILFAAAWQSLKSMLIDPKWCGAQPGMMAVLHTWGQNLSHHPHLHCIVPAGGLSKNGKQWMATKKSSVLVDVKELSALFRKTFLKKLREKWEFEGIDFRGKAEKYHDLAEWRQLFLSVEKPWVVYCQAPSHGATQTLEYLSRYTHSVAISEHRILSLGEKKVTIQYKDYAETDEKGLPKKKTLALEYEHFIKKFVKHILPSGFQKIRYFGIWAMTNRKTKLAMAQKLLQHRPLHLTMQAIKALVKEKFGIDPTICSDCGSTDLVVSILAAPSVFGRKQELPPFFVQRPPPKLLPPNRLVKIDLAA